MDRAFEAALKTAFPDIRPAREVLDDRLDGFCTRSYAERAYGVVIGPDLGLNEAATAARRAAVGAAA